MSWRQQLRQGSFRGLPFLIQASGTEVGRRVALHQYPLRDLPWGEDLGREARGFRIECFVLGPDYMAARDNLIAALEAEGPGTLVHPYLGTRQVVVQGKASISESTREGGMARFSIPFAEAGAKTEPAQKPDTAAGLAGAGDDATDAAANSFSNTYNVNDLPAWVTQQSVSDIGSLTDRLRDLARQWTSIPDELVGWLSQLAEFTSALSALVQAPAGLASELNALIASIGPIFAQPANALDAYSSLDEWEPLSLAVTPILTTPERAQAKINRRSLASLVQVGAVAGACSAVAKIPAQTKNPPSIPPSGKPQGGRTIRGFDNRAAALVVRAGLTAKIEVAQRATSEGAAFVALADLRAALVTDLDTRAAPLPRMIAFTPPATHPALTIAERLYDDPTRAAQIVARNVLAYPGFAPGGQALEVLDA